MAVESGRATDSDMHLFVDLDGTLIRTDLLFESLLLLIRRNPLYLALVPFWLLKGRAWLKHQIARRVEIDPTGLPYNEAFLAWLEDQRARAQAMTLISASNQRYVSAVAQHLGLFDAAIGSDGKTNLKARNKLRRIEEIVQKIKFAYAGDSCADLPVWAGAGQVLLKLALLLQAALADFHPQSGVADPLPQAAHFLVNAVAQSPQLAGAAAGAP